MNIFISMPMNGKTKEEIIKRRNEITILLKERFGNNITIIDSIIEDTSLGPVWCLGQSISLMYNAELVVFDKGWR